MANKPTIKTPIPTTPGFHNFPFACIPVPRGCTCLHPHPLGIRLPYSVSCLLHSVFYPSPLSSPLCRLCPRLLCSSAFLSLVQIRANSWFTLFQVSSWLQVNYAKQTQFPKPSNQHNRLCHKDLRQYPAPPQAEKQTQTNPIYRDEHRISNRSGDPWGKCRVSSVQYPESAILPSLPGDYDVIA